MSTPSELVRRIFFIKHDPSASQKQYLRKLTFEPLEERLALNAAPVLQGLPDTLYLTPGTSYHVALDGKDDDNDDLTYRVESTSNELLTASVLEGNQSVKFSVYHKNTSGSWELVGDMIIELFEDEAPITTQRFKDLVEGMVGSDGKTYKYDGVSIHRIIDGFMFQGGDVKYGTGTGGTGITIPDEYHDLLQHSGRGIVSTANSNDSSQNRYDTNDSQFFITDNATPWLDGKHNVFGFITEGDEVREIVNAIPASNSVPTRDVKMDNFEIFNDTENGTLRIVVPEDAKPGESTITVYVDDGVNEPVPYTINVKIIEEPTSVPTWNAPNQIELEPGQKYTFTLPEYPVPGEIEYVAEPTPGYSSDDLKVSISGRDVTIEVPATGGGLQWISVEARAKDNDNKTYTGYGSAYQYVPLFITPSAPKIALSEKSDSGVVGDNVTSFNNDKAGNELIFEITDVLKDYATLKLYRDGYEVPFEVVSMATQDNGMVKWTVKMKIDEDNPKPLPDGIHAFSAVQIYNPPESTNHEAMSSKASSQLNVVIDTAEFTFVQPGDSTLFDAKIGENLFIQFRTSNHSTGKVQYTIDEVRDGTGKVIEPPEGMKIDATTGALTWTPQSGQVDEYTITVLATDGAGKSAKKSVEVIFQDGPEFSISGSTTQYEGNEFVLELKITEEDFEGVAEFSLKAGTLPEGTQYTIEKIDDQTALFTWYTTEAHGPATYEPVFLVKDSEGQQRRKSVVLTVEEIDEAPKFTGGPVAESAGGWKSSGVVSLNESSGIYTLLEHREFTLQLTAEDPDIYPGAENPLKYTFVGTAPVGMQVDSDTGLITWSPQENQGGFSFEAVVRVTDKTGLYDEITLRFVVNEDDRPPEFLDETGLIEIETGRDLVDHSALAKDPDYHVDPEVPLNGIVYEIEGEDLPPGLQIDRNTGEITWSIPYDFLDMSVESGTITFNVIAYEVNSEGELGLSSTKEITINLSNRAYFDAIAEEAARQARWAAEQAAAQARAGFSTTDALWMLQDGINGPTSGYTPEIYAGHNSYGGLNGFLGGVDSSGKVDSTLREREQEGDSQQNEEEEKTPSRSRRRSQPSAQKDSTESNSITQVLLPESADPYDLGEDYSAMIVNTASSRYVDYANMEEDSEIDATHPQMDDAIAYLLTDSVAY